MTTSTVGHIIFMIALYLGCDAVSLSTGGVQETGDGRRGVRGIIRKDAEVEISADGHVDKLPGFDWLINWATGSDNTEAPKNGSWERQDALNATLVSGALPVLKNDSGLRTDALVVQQASTATNSTAPGTSMNNTAATLVTTKNTDTETNAKASQPATVGILGEGTTEARDGDLSHSVAKEEDYNVAGVLTLDALQERDSEGGSKAVDAKTAKTVVNKMDYDLAEVITKSEAAEEVTEEEGAVEEEQAEAAILKSGISGISSRGTITMHKDGTITTVGTITNTDLVSTEGIFSTKGTGVSMKNWETTGNIDSTGTITMNGKGEITQNSVITTGGKVSAPGKWQVTGVITTDGVVVADVSGELNM